MSKIFLPYSQKIFILDFVEPSWLAITKTRKKIGVLNVLQCHHNKLNSVGSKRCCINEQNSFCVMKMHLQTFNVSFVGNEHQDVHSVGYSSCVCHFLPSHFQRRKSDGPYKFVKNKYYVDNQFPAYRAGMLRYACLTFPRGINLISISMSLFKLKTVIWFCLRNTFNVPNLSKLFLPSCVLHVHWELNAV